MTLAALPNPNSGIDAVTLRDGRHLMVYNHTWSGRSPLNVAVPPTAKRGRRRSCWRASRANTRTRRSFRRADGLVHITYTWKRQRIKHVVVDRRR